MQPFLCWIPKKAIHLLPLSSKVRMNELHAVADNNRYGGIILRKNKTAVVLDDQVRVCLSEEAYEVGQRR